MSRFESNEELQEYANRQYQQEREQLAEARAQKPPREVITRRIYLGAAGWVELRFEGRLDDLSREERRWWDELNRDMDQLASIGQEGA